MKIIFLDSTAVPNVTTGPGSPAYFSRFVIDLLRKQGHNVTIVSHFDEQQCADADVVVAEWVNDLAYAAAESGVCKKLVLRMRGYDVWGPLDKLAWENVDALVFESDFLAQLAWERSAKLRAMVSSVAGCTIPSGVDLARFKFKERKPYTSGSQFIVALVARATSDKGQQLAMEWARSRPRDVRLHITTALGETNPRLVRYLEKTAPENVTIHGNVDPATWLDEIDASYILSTSIWETLGYSIAEGMAMGLKPLVHTAPGTSVTWPSWAQWQSLGQLNALVGRFHEGDDSPMYQPPAPQIDSRRYRTYVEENLDAAKLSDAFIQVLLEPSRRPAPSIEAIRKKKYDYRQGVFDAAWAAARTDVDPAPAAALVEDFRRKFPLHSMASDERYGLAMAISAAYYNGGQMHEAEKWACRALLDFARPDAFCMLGEAAAVRGDLEEAVRWYRVACAADDVPHRYRQGAVIHMRASRLRELEAQLPKLPPGAPTPMFRIIVTVRNGRKWIAKCLESIAKQSRRNFTCVVVDDVSTDETAEVVRQCILLLPETSFTLVRNTERKYQARNTVEQARLVTNPEDVIVLVDGDDWLAHHDVLARIERAYTEQGAWMTYGSIVDSKGNDCRFSPYALRIAQEGRFHEWAWCATQIRTFKRFMLDELKDEDFTLDGEWVKTTGDVAVLLPMLQLACERAVPITDTLYVYNVETPDNEHKLFPDEQVRVRDRLFDRPPKKRLPALTRLGRTPDNRWT